MTINSKLAIAGAWMISAPDVDFLTDNPALMIGNSKPESFNRISQKGRRKRARQARSRK